ncbi:MAG: MotA/TolQ/ExbB proton channel family protein, partial [Candidatus Omnitrophota bacterium]
MRKVAVIPVIVAVIMAAAYFTAPSGICEDAQLAPYIQSVDQAKAGMTLWQMIKTGGFIMIILSLLSMAMVGLIVYNFMTLKTELAVPKNFTEGLIKKLEEGKFQTVKTMCSSERNIIASISNAGLERRDKDRLLAREAMENTARKEVGALWQGISYLADIAAIAPLIGLLGTVIGMIQAFNVIAFQTAVVKPILL